MYYGHAILSQIPPPKEVLSDCIQHEGTWHQMLAYRLSADSRKQCATILAQMRGDCPGERLIIVPIISQKVGNIMASDCTIAPEIFEPASL